MGDREMRREVNVRTARGAVKIGLPVGAALFGLGLAAGPAQATDFTVTNLTDSGTGSFRDALEAATANPGADRILFQSGLSGTINVQSHLPLTQGSIEILGPGPATLKVDGGGESSLLAINGAAKISGLTLSGAVSYEDCYIYDPGGPYEEEYCDAQPGSALISVGNSDLTLDNMVFRDNVSDSIGGALAFQSLNGKLKITDSEFTDNEAGSGGAVMTAGTTTVTGSTFSGNSASLSGGAIQTYGYFEEIGGLTVDGSTFDDNNASRAGGAISTNSPAAVTIQGSTFTGNDTELAGGAVSLFGGESGITIEGSTFSGNSVDAPTDDYYSYDSRGGAASIHSHGETRIANSTFIGNKAIDGFGGAIELSEDGGVLGSSYGANEPTDGNVVIDSLTVVGNSASGATGDDFGTGGIYQWNWPATLVNSIVSGNTGGAAPDLGGGAPYEYYDETVPAGEFQTSFSLVGDVSGTAFRDAVSGSNLLGVDPQLGPLAPNEGPTQTMIPAATSPVINKGSSTLTKDQRGLPRPVDYYGVPFSTAPGANGADVGAVELTSPPPPPPPPPAPKLTFKKVTFNKKKGTATAFLSANRDGRIILSGRYVKQLKKQVKAGLVKVPLKAKGKALKQLNKKGKAKIKVGITLKTGEVGGTWTLIRNFKLIKKKPQKPGR